MFDTGPILGACKQCTAVYSCVSIVTLGPFFKLVQLQIKEQRIALCERFGVYCCLIFWCLVLFVEFSEYQ